MSLNEELFEASRDNEVETVQRLLSEGADANARDEDITPLHTACCYGFTQIASILLEHGANINAQNSEGSSPLHFAVEFEFPETVKLLLDHGADISIRDRDGETPLDRAKMEGNTAILSLFKA